LLPTDVREREIVFDDTSNELYVKKNSQELLVKYSESSDSKTTTANTWS